MSSFDFRPSRDYGDDWAAYFREYAAQRDAALGAEAAAADREAAELAADSAHVEGTIVVEPASQVDPASVTRASPKKIITHAARAGFQVTAQGAVTLHPGKVFKSGAKAGERAPDKQKEHLWVNAVIPRLAAFQVGFEDGRFAYAFVVDAAGWPTEVWADYSIGAQQRKQLGLSEAQADLLSQRRGYDYNTGEFEVRHGKRLVTSMAAFEDWIGDLIPGYPVRKVAKKKQPTMEDDVQMFAMAGADWVG